VTAEPQQIRTAITSQGSLIDNEKRLLATIATRNAVWDRFMGDDDSSATAKSMRGYSKIVNAPRVDSLTGDAGKTIDPSIRLRSPESTVPANLPVTITQIIVWLRRYRNTPGAPNFATLNGMGVALKAKLEKATTYYVPNTKSADRDKLRGLLSGISTPDGGTLGSFTELVDANILRKMVSWQTLVIATDDRYRNILNVSWRQQYEQLFESKYPGFLTKGQLKTAIALMEQLKATIKLFVRDGQSLIRSKTHLTDLVNNLEDLEKQAELEADLNATIATAEANKSKIRITTIPNTAALSPFSGSSGTVPD
jgi:hypothetical protein